MTIVDRVFELSELAVQEARRYVKKRFLFNDLLGTVGKHYIGILGPRGTGKSVLLKQLAHEIKHSLYLSLDSLEIDSLFDLIKTLNAHYKIKTFLLDEVHFYKNIEQELKKCYDFLDVRVFFTSSVALSMIHSSYDLSRRVQLFKLPVFSYREYLFFKKDSRLLTLSLNDILDKNYDDQIRYPHEFDAFLKGGVLPFSLEEPQILPLVSNVLDKIIERDIPTVARLHTDELVTIKKLVSFVGKAEVDGINISTLSNNLGVTKYKADQYVQLLSQSFVLNKVFPTGTNVSKEPKILMNLPYRLLFKPYEECIGGLREDFFCQMLSGGRYSYTFLKSKRGEKTPDYLISLDDKSLVAEVGGKGKGRSQFKGIIGKPKLVFFHGDVLDRASRDEAKRPLFLAGFLY